MAAPRPEAPDLRSLLLQHFPDILVFLDRSGTVLEVQADDAQFDLARALFRPGEPVIRVWPPDNASLLSQTIQAQFLAPLARQVIPALELSARVGDTERWFEVRVLRIKRDRVCLVVRDIAERRATEHALRLATQAAEAASRSKSTFLANMSHEIRTPMNGIVGMIQLLEPTLTTEEQREFARTVRASADHLLAIINDILDLSKIEAGHVEMEPSEFGLVHEIKSIASMFRRLCEDRGLALQVQMGPELPLRAVGPAERLWQILNNLLGNALKFTREGTISISFRAEAITEQGFTLTVEVRDTGIGIPADRLERIFQPFTQADSSTTRRFGGTGLGLTICRQLLHAMGGDIVVESMPNVGSTFRFWAPLRQSSTFVPASTRPRIVPLPRRRHPGTDRRHRRVLLAEDNPVNRTVVTRMLERLEFEVVQVENGLQVLQTLAHDTDFDGILMDVQMPELDGIETTQRLRADRAFDFLPIVALTAHAMRGDEERCLAAGMTDYLSKPIRANELARVCELVFLMPQALARSTRRTQPMS